MTGLTIKLARIKAGMKGYELARLVQITPDRLSKIENGHIEASEEIIARIKKFIEIDEKQKG